MYAAYLLLRRVRFIDRLFGKWDKLSGFDKFKIILAIVATESPLLVIEFYFWPIDLFIWWRHRKKVRMLKEQEELSASEDAQGSEEPRECIEAVELVSEVHDILCDWFQGAAVVLQDVIIPAAEYVVECDLIAIHPTGIFVIGCLDIPGVIYGTGEDAPWHYWSCGEKRVFDSPIPTLEDCCCKVARLLRVESHLVVPIFLFRSESDLRCSGLKGEGRDYYIAKSDTLVDIMEDLILGPTILGDSDVQAAVNTLRAYSNSLEG